MHRLTPAYDPPNSKQHFAALAGAIEAWEHTGQPGPAIIANTLAWAAGYTQIAPNPEDLFPHVPAMNAYDDMHPAEHSDRPDRQSSMRVDDPGNEDRPAAAELQAKRAELQAINQRITDLVEGLFTNPQSPNDWHQ